MLCLMGPDPGTVISCQSRTIRLFVWAGKMRLPLLHCVLRLTRLRRMFRRGAMGWVPLRATFVVLTSTLGSSVPRRRRDDVVAVALKAIGQDIVRSVSLQHPACA